MAEKLYAVCGKPIIHSKSPYIFSDLFSKNDLKHVYFRILTESAKDCIRLMNKIDISAINATAPLKEDLFRLLKDNDDNAKISQSVNCVVKKNNSFKGFSTDHFGVINSLIANNIDPKNEKFLIIGAGGAAAAATYGLYQYTNNIVILNRTIERAEKLAKRFTLHFDILDNIQKWVNSSTVIISTLPAEADFPQIEIPPDVKAVLDANYKKSKIYNKININNTIFINGESWLINQAIPAFNIFTGKTNIFKLEKLNAFKNYDSIEPIIITGFMCAGKTILSRLLAKKMGKIFIDLDEEIEKRSGKTISEIFEEDGVTKFREYETNFLKDILKNKNIILSTGGGIVEKEINREILKHYLTIWIYSEPTSVFKRNKGGRPLLNNQTEKDIKILFNSRKFNYAKSCDFMIENKNIDKTVEAIFEEIS